MFHKESVSLKFDKNIAIRNKIPNTLDVDTTPSEQRTFKGPVPTFRDPVLRSMTIHCVLYPGHSTN